MLIGNYSTLNKTPGRWISGTTTAGAAQAFTRANYNRNSDWRKFSLQDRCGGTGSITLLQLAGMPFGYRPPGAWALPTKSGGLSSYNPLISITMSGSGALGRNIEGSTDISLTVDATGQLVVSGVGSFTMALTASGNIIASKAAVGSFTMSVATDTSTATAKGWMSGSATASMSFSATRYATGALAGDFSANYEFSPDNLAAAVWNALTSSYNVSGSFGEAMAAAGSAGDPWSTTLPGSYTGSQAGAIMVLVRKLLQNKTVTDPDTGVMTIYDDDGSTVLLQGNVFNDAAGATPYDGTAGINQRDALV